MMGAYPMMARHGGKLMSELLSCVGRAQRELQIQEKVKRKFGTSDNVDLSTSYITCCYPYSFTSISFLQQTCR